MCMYCEREIRGRVDKKFCSDQCRNDYNNQLKYSSNNVHVRNINRALKKNRRILEQLMTSDKDFAKVFGDKLNAMGFKFKYFMHVFSFRKIVVIKIATGNINSSRTHQYKKHNSK